MKHKRLAQTVFVSVILAGLVLSTLFTGGVKGDIQETAGVTAPGNANVAGIETIGDADTTITEEAKRIDAGLPIVSDPKAQSVDNPLSYMIDDILDDKPVFVFFYSDWCHFCHQQMPIIDELEEECAGELAFIRINVGERPDYAEEFGVSALPTTLVISDKNEEGYVKQEISGFAEKEGLREIIGLGGEHKSDDVANSIFYWPNRGFVGSAGASSCVVPYDDMQITQDTTLCEGDYILNDPAANGVLIIKNANITLDCNGASLLGNVWGIGIYNDGYDNVTIKNCNISNYLAGIELLNLKNGDLRDNSITTTGTGIMLSNVDNSYLGGNTVKNSQAEGIALWGSNNNELDSNESCANYEFDIYVSGGSGNYGDNNRCDCDRTSGWNENGACCTYACDECLDHDQDGYCDDDDNCPWIHNPDQEDIDTDGTGDVCDNCPNVHNPDQNNSDLFDDQGDVCDNCWFEVDSEQYDGDGDCETLQQDSKYWDGTKWLKDPHCGYMCDNCPEDWNPDQKDTDEDNWGDKCDYCPNKPSWGNDYDGDAPFCSDYLPPTDPEFGCGDKCDNCWMRPNKDQSDEDKDGIGDTCDNCWKKKNNDQNDKDLDCLILPPYNSDPHCGDACDNCPARANMFQEDWDEDGEGDACDCDDGFMGPNEDGADCGGICANTCPQKCIPIIKQGDPSGKIDVVFIPTLDYPNVNAFASDALEVIFYSYFNADIISANKEKINFWYINKLAPFKSKGKDLPCEWSEPNKWKEDCPQGAIGIILHKAKCRDYRLGDVFSAQYECWRVFIHEAGHAIFGLQDEYDDNPNGCTTGYKECKGPYCNIYKTKASCQLNSLTPADCIPFTSCKDGWWTAQPDYTIMGALCGPVNSCGLCTWGPDAERQVKHVFSQYVDPPADETRKAIVGYFHYDGENIEMYDSAIVYGDSPERFLDWDKLRLVFLNSNEELINEFNLWDPRYKDYFNPVGGELLDEVNFSLAFPFMDNIKTLDIYDVETGELLAAIDLSDSVREFCNEYPIDPQCISYDSDNDSVADIEDNCPNTVNPDQLDSDADGIGDVCEAAAPTPTPTLTPTSTPTPTPTPTLTPTSTPTPTPTPMPAPAAGLGPGVWTGIGIGSLVAVLLLFGLGLWLGRRRGKGAD